MINTLKTEQYIDVLYDNNFLPIITKPTRVTEHTITLIDHIYTNIPVHRIVPGVVTMDISYHLPIFCVIDLPIEENKSKHYYRDYTNFNKEAYLSDIYSIDWLQILDEHENINSKTSMFIEKVKMIVNKHCPNKQIPRKKIKQLVHKPWITKGLIKSIKVKQKLYRTHYLSNDLVKKQQYKKYSNTLNNLKNKIKKGYFKEQFQLCKSNLKTTWKLIGTLINRKQKSQTHPMKFSTQFQNIYRKE